jgi:hypothetical protein
LRLQRSFWVIDFTAEELARRRAMDAWDLAAGGQ